MTPERGRTLASRLDRHHLPTLPLGNVARGIAVVGVSTMLGQGAVVLASPALARLYDPVAFGVFAVFAALLSVLSAVGSLRYDFAVPLADDREEAMSLLAISVGLAAVTSILVGLLVLVAGPEVAAFLGTPDLAPFLWLLPVAVLVAAAVQALAAWATYHRTFTALARMKASQGVGQAGVQLLLGAARSGAGGLIVGDLAGRAIAALQLARPVRGALATVRPSVHAITTCARARWPFARVMVVASLLSEVSLQVPFLMIPALFDVASAGEYFLVYRLLVLPGALAAAGVSQVFFGEAAVRRADPARLHALARNVAVSLLAFSIPTYGLLAVAAPAIVETVFGAQWAAAGSYARILAPPLALWSVANPISTLLLVGRREHESLFFTATELGLKAGSLVIGAAFASLTVGLIVLSVVSAVMYVAALWRFLRVASVSLAELWRPGARILALTVPFLVPVGVVTLTNPAWALPASGIAWGACLALAVRGTPEARALLRGTDD